MLIGQGQVVAQLQHVEDVGREPAERVARSCCVFGWRCGREEGVGGVTGRWGRDGRARVAQVDRVAPDVGVAGERFRTRLVTVALGTR